MSSVGQRGTYNIRGRYYCGERLQLARAHQLLSQAELGERAGYNGGTIGKFERSELPVKADAVFAFARELEVSPQWLAGIEGNKV